MLKYVGNVVWYKIGSDGIPWNVVKSDYCIGVKLILNKKYIFYEKITFDLYKNGCVRIFEKYQRNTANNSIGDNKLFNLYNIEKKLN